MNKFLVEPVGYKRIFAFILDLFLTIIVGLILFLSFEGNLLLKAFGGETSLNNITSFAVDSGLAYVDKDTNSLSVYVYNAAGTEDKDKGYIATPKGEKGYEAYLDKVWNYYTDFVNPFNNQDSRINAKEDATSADYYKFTLDVVFKLGKDYETNKYFEYKKDSGGNIDYQAKPILNAKYQELVSNNDTEALEELLKYFDDSDTGLYYSAIYNMQGTRYYTNWVRQTYYANELQKYQAAYWAASSLTYLPIGAIFFFVIPLCSKKGQTLGKKAFKIIVVSDKGFYMDSFQKVVRPLLVSLLNLMLLLPNALTGFILHGILCLVSFIFSVAGKKRKNIHERLTNTVAVDSTKSIIFENQEEKDKYIEENNLLSDGTPKDIIAMVNGINLRKE